MAVGGPRDVAFLVPWPCASLLPSGRCLSPRSVYFLTVSTLSGSEGLSRP